MKIDEGRVFQNFPNGLRQIWVSDEARLLNSSVKPNRFQIVDQNGDPVIDELFSGCVYLNESKIEVYRDNPPILGIFEIGKGVDWDVKTPNEIRSEESTAFRQRIQYEFEKLTACCSCQYPRILEYIENRHSEDSRYLERQILTTFLVEKNRVFDDKTDLEITFLECKHCDSEYQWRYRERSVDSLKLIKLANMENVGEAPDEWAPNYLDALFGEIFYRNSHRYQVSKKMHQATLDELINYLFKIKTDN